MNKYTTLLFDADETLLDFISAEAMAIHSVCNDFSIPYSEELRRLYSGINAALWKQLEKGLVTRDIIKIRRFEQLLEATSISADPKRISDAYAEALSHYGMVLNGAIELCQTLSPHFDMYIVTNGTAHIQRRRLAVSGLLPYFSGVFISEDVGSQKPEKKFFDHVFANIPEKNKEKICIIGDSMSSDILGGINAGIDTCYYAPETANKVYTPTYTAKSYADILKIFLKEG